MATIGLISDIHGNAVALEAALEDLQHHPVDQLVCLGDSLQGGVQPVQVAERLVELGCPVVLGNSDAWLVTGEAAHPVSAELQTVGEWTRAQLGDDGLKLIASFEPTVRVDVDGLALLGFHGSPTSYDDVVLPETPREEAEQLLGSHDVAVLAGGHTHLQWSRAVGTATYVNPGSIGLAYARYLPAERFYFYPHAEYAVVHVEDGRASIEFCRVPVDLDALEAAALASSHPFAERESRRFRARS